MSNIPFLIKYKPSNLNDLLIDNDMKTILKGLINISNLNILFLGNNCSGKTSILKVIINEYFKDLSIKEQNNNILFINSLKEQGINFYRTEVKTFCQSKSLIPGKKKIIMIDDIDTINIQSQQVFRNCLDKYSKNINIIASANNNQKVIDSIQSRLLTIKIKQINNNQLLNILKDIKVKEKINFDSKIDEFIINISNNSIRVMLNYLEKIKIFTNKITLKNYKNFCSNISYIEFEEYTDYCKKNDIKNSIKIIYNLYNYGYSVIDILDGYYNFIKIYKLEESIKYKIIHIITEYIAIFHGESEDELELSCLTFDLINLFNS
jgi:replication factor C subunit 2/4